MSSLIITVDDTVDIVMSASPGATSLGVTAYAKPVILAANTYAPTSPYLHGATALAWRYDQSMLNFTVAPFLAASESAAAALVAALRLSVSRLSFNVTTNENGVSEVWRCDAGSVTPAVPRTRINLDRPHILEWNVSIPCSPVAS